MKAIVIEEECHGDIKVCADMRSAFEWLLLEEWIAGGVSQKNINNLMSEYEKDKNFLDGQFYFHEINIFKGDR